MWWWSSPPHTRPSFMKGTSPQLHTTNTRLTTSRCPVTWWTSRIPMGVSSSRTKKYLCNHHNKSLFKNTPVFLTTRRTTDTDQEHSVFSGTNVARPQQQHLTSMVRLWRNSQHPTMEYVSTYIPTMFFTLAQTIEKPDQGSTKKLTISRERWTMEQMPNSSRPMTRQHETTTSLQLDSWNVNNYHEQP